VAVAEATLFVSAGAGAPAAWWPASGSAAEAALMATASLAGVGAAKRTSSLIPLCHPLPLDGADVAVGRPAAARGGGGWGVTVTASVRTTQRTGVEMEALAAAAVGALTLYDMLKGQVAQQCLEVDGIRVLRKEGGKRDFRREEA
jgi:cyclic pyranopterin phosphate synthase